MRHALILLAHGSADPQWRRPFLQLVRDLQAPLRGMTDVRLAFMEFARPTLLDAARQAVQDGRRSLSVLPLFLAAGAHLSREIPVQIEGARKQFPDLQIALLPPIGEDRRVMALFREIALEHLAQQVSA